MASLSDRTVLAPLAEAPYHLSLPVTGRPGLDQLCRI
jgi:hypothetical protein